MRWLLLTLSLITACAPFPSAVQATAVPAGERVEEAGAMAARRASHSASLLPDGRVLIAGGYDGECRIASTEIFDPATGMTSPGAPLGVPRCSHSATSLPDGRILIAGGWSGATVVGTTEIFDPKAGSFTPAAAMQESRAAHIAVVLHDGRILVAGGSDGSGMRASAEVYDPARDSWTRTGQLRSPRVAAIAVRLQDGTVLVAGGSPRRGEVVASAEVYDPATGAFRETGGMTVARHKHAAALLPDGAVLVLGGSDERDGRGQYAKTEIYDPRARTFAATTDMSAPRFKLPDAVTTLPGGEVLVAGGALSAEVFEPATKSFRTVPGSFGAGRSFSTTTALRDGSVLIAGGYDERIRVSSALYRYRR